MFAVVDGLLRSNERLENYLKMSFDEKRNKITQLLSEEIDAAEATELCSVIDLLVQQQASNSEELKRHFLY